MIRIKNYKLFLESLKDDFDNVIKTLGDNKDDANNFLKSLTDDKDKQEFMYRISDGENIIDLIEEFVDKCQLSDKNQFRFRTLVMSVRLDEIKSKYNEDDRNAGTKLVMIAEKDGIDKTMSSLEMEIERRPEITPDRIIDLIQTSIDWLQENEELINWAYQRDENTNQKKIEAGKILIDRLREFSGDY